MGNDIESVETIRSMKKLMQACLDEVREVKKLLLKNKKGAKPEEEVKE